jgi:hypothetical protein
MDWQQYLATSLFQNIPCWIENSFELSDLAVAILALQMQNTYLRFFSNFTTSV